ncbi:MAG: DeoR/GlpR family DNA-binding transcription regulator [Eubacteriales bacterium]
MPFSDREEKILDILRRQGSAGADEMARELYISRPTLRRDLIKLEQKGAVTRTHGGAKLTTRPADDTIPASLRMDEDSRAKNMIAAEAAKLVRDGDTVMLDGSTTALHLAAALRGKRDIVVITSGARTALILGGMGINTICTGGQLIGSSECSSGATR